MRPDRPQILRAAAVAAVALISPAIAQAQDFVFRIPVRLDMRNLPQNQSMRYEFRCEVFPPEGSAIGRSTTGTSGGVYRQVMQFTAVIPVTLDPGHTRDQAASYTCRLRVARLGEEHSMSVAEFASQTGLTVGGVNDVVNARLERPPVRPPGAVGPGALTAPRRPRE